MRVLFYTAIALFTLLLGIFAFYALRTPENGGGAKVVLSIDSGKMPAPEAQASPDAERDVLAEAAGKLKRDNDGDAAPAAEDLKPSFSAQGAVPETASDDANQAQASTQENGEPDQLPGTTVAGLDNDKLTTNEISKAPADPLPNNDFIVTAPTVLSTQSNSNDGGQALSSSQQASADTPPTQPAGIAATDPGVKPGRFVSSEPEPKPSATAVDPVTTSGAVPQKDGGKVDVNAVLAALNEKEASEPAAPTVPPPPLPNKRPANPPKTVALNGWTAKSFTTTEVATPGSARIAILLRGVGRDDRISDEAITKLPPAVSLAFVPFDGSAQQWAKKARETGHEVIVQLPLEPSDYPVNNPGPETLLSSSSSEENLSRLRAVLGSFDGYTGVSNLLGGKFLQSKVALRPILEEVKARGLMYIGEGNNSHGVVRGIAKEIGLRYGGADTMIDIQPSPTAIRKALDQLVATARKQGSAIGMGTVSRTTIEQVESWSQQLEAQGVTLVPVGVLAQSSGAS